MTGADLGAKTGIWEFALRFYGMPGVSAACLTLQDEADVDVVLVIAIVYADWTDRPLGTDGIRRLRTAMAEWRAKTVLPLRSVRRFLKAPQEDLDAEKEELRHAVKAAELKAEQVQLNIAENCLSELEAQAKLPLAQALTELLSLSPNVASTGDVIRDAVKTIASARMKIEPPRSDVGARS